MRQAIESIKTIGVLGEGIETNKPLRLNQRLRRKLHLPFLFWLLIMGVVLSQPIVSNGQDTVTGAFEGRVTDKLNPSIEISGAQVRITNVDTGKFYDAVTDSQGRFFQGLLAPGTYKITVIKSGFQTVELQRELKISIPGEVVPVPVEMEPLPPGTNPTTPVTDVSDNIRIEMNTLDGRRSGSFREKELTRLPLGAITITRTFDELALLLSGVVPPPQTIGEVAGPGVGPGVGSAGQFSVNGLRSRGNNFTVDGSDNNDEDIGVRRQGYVALNSQPIESVKEYQVITLLAPAQFGRNFGAQVNAVSKRGGDRIRGTVYGFLNSNVLNAQNYFDTINVNNESTLRTSSGQSVLVDNVPVTVRNFSGGEDSFTFAQGGATLSGKIITNKLFYFLSGEYQKINASQEKSFAVPTVEQRGLFGMGATGIFQNYLYPNNDPRLRLCNLQNPSTPFDLQTCNTTPTTLGGSAIFSLFPFPNNPNGVYGANTFTQVLPASGRGLILSARLDHEFSLGERAQSLTGRYNFTDDERNIPSVNNAIYSTVLAKVRTHNFSSYYNSELTHSDTGNRLFNQVRFSFGRTRLNFDEVRDPSLLNSGFGNSPFLLNSKFLRNDTMPAAAGVGNSNAVRFNTLGTVENALNMPIGQVVVGGFSPLGTDVYNFPQKRTNNTYQIADELTWRQNGHNYVFGTDIRRTDLDSDLPRLSRPLLTFNGVPRLTRQSTPCANNRGFQRDANYYCFPSANDFYPVIMPTDLVSLSVASNALLTYTPADRDAQANLRYYQFNFYAQDSWRVKYNLSISYGLRYEYNSPVHEVNGLIEGTFSDPLVNSLAPGLLPFIDGRTGLYDPDKNNFAPRLGIAYSPNIWGNRTTVFRGGYGIFYDQILGAVVNQSRYVFPTFVTVNFGGLSNGAGNTVIYDASNFRRPNTTNVLNGDVPQLINSIRNLFPDAITATLPARNLEMPMAHHYDFVFEQQLNSNLTFSVGYIGTRGRHLLRFTTPNNGSSLINVPVQIITPLTPAPLAQAEARGISLSPERPFSGTSRNSVNIFETTASSDYNSLQTELRGRFSPGFDFQFSYTYSKVNDDVSDVFDLAGAYVLPQDSYCSAGESNCGLAAERGPANFDVRHRWSYYMIYSFPKLGANYNFFRFLTDNLQIASTGRFHSGQPFTVNSVIDVNLDGNLTDRLNTTDGITVTGNRSQPLQLTTNNTLSLLAPFGENGRIGRNTFRAGNFLELDLSLIKRFPIRDGGFTFRMDIFNFINRANFGVPNRILESPGFGKATSTVTPGRRVQFSLKYDF
jgi:hypothetical protein